MNYKEARVYLDDVAKYGSVLGLDNMRELLRRLDNPQDALKFIHISGTNGKGSVLAYLSTVLKEAGYRVGRYISPTLFSYRERIQVNEEEIHRDSLAAHVTQIREVIDGMTAEGLVHPTQFEIETALSFLYFAELKCDIVVLETGMGGLTDATNIITTTVMEVLVSISMDHMQFLGDTLEKIAEQKAGIIKPNTTVVSYLQQPEAMAVIERTAKEKDCTLYVADPKKACDIHYGIEKQQFSYGTLKDLTISLAGSYQIDNAVTAVEAVMALQKCGYPVSEEQLRVGLEKTTWKGRFSVLQKEPLFILDGAHNRDGARVLRDSIGHYFAGRRLIYIVGVFRDKEYETVLETVSPFANDLIAIQTPGNPRALPAEELAKTAEKFYEHAYVSTSLADAVERAKQLADGPDDVILAFGSLSFHGALLKVLEGE